MIPLKPKGNIVERPSYRELDNKLKELRVLLADGRWRPADLLKLRANFDDLEQKFGLDTTTSQDQATLLLSVAHEISPRDYAGTRPPQEAYEESIRGEDLFAFRWKSAFFGNEEMYFKFALRGADKGRRAYICSIHEDDKKSV